MAKIDPVARPAMLDGARVAVFGYDDPARAHALALRRAGHEVAIAVPLDGVCAARARADGFAVAQARSAAEQADVIALLVHDAARVWLACAPWVVPGKLVIVRRARALVSDAFDRPDLAIAVVVRGDGQPWCRLAIHRDGTGRALAGAIGFARAAYGPEVEIAVTSVRFELAVEGAKPRNDDDDEPPCPPRSGAW